MPDHIEGGLAENRLALCGQDLHAGEPLELLVGGAWVLARVEWSPTLGWYAIARQSKDHSATREISFLLRPGMVARPMRDRQWGRASERSDDR